MEIIRINKQLIRIFFLYILVPEWYISTLPTVWQNVTHTLDPSTFCLPDTNRLYYYIEKGMKCWRRVCTPHLFVFIASIYMWSVGKIHIPRHWRQSSGTKRTWTMTSMSETCLLFQQNITFYDCCLSYFSDYSSCKAGDFFLII